MLNSIGLKYGTDKASSKHNYLVIYEKYFEKYCRQNITVSEIGIFKGVSLKTWKEYFPHAQIIGLDIANKKMYEEDRIKTIKGNQNSEQDLVKIPHSDIIIDDGSHQIPDMVKSFTYLYTHRLKSNGIYIIEDLHATYMEKPRGNIREDFEKLILATILKCDKTPEVKFVHFYKNLMIIGK